MLSGAGLDYIMPECPQTGVEKLQYRDSVVYGNRQRLSDNACLLFDRLLSLNQLENSLGGVGVALTNYMHDTVEPSDR